jgi:hypothetical protein
MRVHRRLISLPEGSDAANPNDAATELQIERILHSETLRSSEALRRLFRYLADKTLDGQADQLKEYTVGIEGLGKPATYDPRQESIVRIQAARLRQKLSEYYHGEGKLDPIVVELPKGHFKLRFGTGADRAEPEIGGSAATGAVIAQNRSRFRMVIGILLLAVSAVAIYSTTELWRERRQTELFRAVWTPEIEALWSPFVSSDRGLIVAVHNPTFVSVPGFGVYRDGAANSWDELMQSPATASMRVLNKSEFHPLNFYTGTGEAGASLHLGTLLGPRAPHMTLIRISDLSWGQFADNNVIFVGPAAPFQERLQSLPVELQLMEDERQVWVLHKRPGEPPLPTLHPSDLSGTGEQFALVTTTPGPLGKGVVRAFESIGTSARLAAVQAFSDPSAARILLSKLRDRTGITPLYFQLLLKVSYKNGVATDLEYVLHRELSLKRPM